MVARWRRCGLHPGPPVPRAATIGYMTDQAARQPGTRALAWGLAGLILLVLAGALVLLAFNARVMTPTRIGAYVFAVVAVVVYAGVGGLIAARVPGNAIGWLLSLIGLLLAVSMFLEQYGLRGLATAPGSLPAVRPITALGSSTQNLAVTTLIVLVLLFPDGRLPSRRWRPVLWIAIAAVIVSGLGQFLQRGTVVQGSLTNALLGRARGVPEPVRRLPAQRLVQRPPRSGGADRGDRRPARADFGVRPAARGVRRAAAAARLAGLRRRAHAGLRGI